MENGGDQLIISGANDIVANYRYRLYKSFNSGNSWNEIFRTSKVTADFTKYIQSISFINNNVGFLNISLPSFTIGKPTTLYKTQDGGNKWDSVTTYIHDGPIKFFDESIAYGMFKSEKSIKKSTDGGKSWVDEFTLPNENQDEKIFFFNDSNFYVTNAGKLYKRDRMRLKVEEPTLNNFEVKVYPNPVAEKLNIVLENGNEGVVKVKLISIEGKEIFSKIFRQNELSIDFTDIAFGIYELQVQAGGKSYHAKVIKER
jgi:photosystem II stability/assembly factor-like uncharacterized protein